MTLDKYIDWELLAREVMAVLAGIAAVRLFHPAVSPLTAAMVSTVLFALVQTYWDIRPWLDRTGLPAAYSGWYFAGITVLMSLGLLALIASFPSDEVASFQSPYANGLRMSVAFVVPAFISILEALARHHKHAPILQVLIWVSFFWVAPWYIFFSVPGFLVMTMGGFLPVTSVTEMSILLTLILSGKLIGKGVATWLNQAHEDT